MSKCPNCGVELSRKKGQISGRKFLALAFTGLFSVGAIATVAYVLSHCIIFFGRFICA